MQVIEIPARFKDTTVSLYGEKGVEWLDALPNLLSAIASQYGLSLLDPFPNLTYHFVVPVTMSDGTDAVLKVGVPNPEMRSEIEALRHFAGVGAVTLLTSEPDLGLLIIERLHPGTPLTQMAIGDEQQDAEATAIACDVMRGLWREASDSALFRHTGELASGFERLRSQFAGGTGPFPEPLVAAAEGYWAELEASSSRQVLLHGDLHHDNILAAQARIGAWLAIDPKGYVGDPAFDTGALLRNLWRDRCHILDPAARLRRRIDQMSDELDLERSRIHRWGVAQAVLSVWWSYEDGDTDWAGSLDIAELIAAC